MKWMDALSRRRKDVRRWEGKTRPAKEIEMEAQKQREIYMILANGHPWRR